MRRLRNLWLMTWENYRTTTLASMLSAHNVALPFTATPPGV